MNIQKVKRLSSIGATLLISAVLAGCPCEECARLNCGEGTMEQMNGDDRTCVVTPVSCGSGAHEQATGGQRECVPDNPDNILECGTDTYQQEQATGGQRECVPGETSCLDGEIEVLHPDETTSCSLEALSCADGTHEQATGGQRECVLDDSNLGCGEGTHEQATGGQRECVPDAP